MTEHITATERLRALLDEHGVEWRHHGEKRRTWFDVNEIAWFAIEKTEGYLIVNSSPLTPEQAIEATLGRGTCHEVVDKSVSWYTTVCSECGFTLAVEQYGPSNFCPQCGRRIEVDDG